MFLISCFYLWCSAKYVKRLNNFYQTRAFFDDGPNSNQRGVRGAHYCGKMHKMQHVELEPQQRLACYASSMRERRQQQRKGKLRTFVSAHPLHLLQLSFNFKNDVVDFS